ncbi:MAG: hypothetical protein GEV04_20540 [Actinophytocola sp.]|nr:hypothetical protein [Actinophytocola sp.]
MRAHLDTLLAHDGKGGAVPPQELVDNFTSPSPGLLRQALRVLRRAGHPALRDFIQASPRLARVRFRRWRRFAATRR